jgi:amino acid adenylation domain-containing protein/non-ribosomal peptide synthase protein (TIGR01720 family)
MIVTEILAELTRHGVVLRADGDKLTVRAPPGVLTPPLRSALATHKAEILARLAAPAPEVTSPGPGPLAPAQQGLWLVAALDPGSAAYNLAIEIHLHGPLPVAALEQSLAEIVRRHEVLRTTFTLVAGEPAAVVGPPLPLALVLVDVAGRADAAAEAARLALEEAHAPFDLGAGPLFRARLVRVAADEHHLLLTVHHIVFDVSSTGVLLRELAALFGACTGRAPASLPPLPFTFAAHVRRQLRRLDEPDLAAQLAYWRRQLADLPPPLRLPSDRPHGAARTPRGDRLGVPVPPPLLQALVALGRREGGTLFMTLLSAFAVLLGRLGGERDLAIGVPTAGRDRSGTEGLIGCFINTLALRVELGGDPTFTEVLARVRRTALDAYAHAEVPFDRVVAEVQPARHPGRTPIFQVMFNLVNLDGEQLTLPGLTAEVRQAMPGARFDLTLYARQREGELRLELSYSADLFDGARVAILLEQLLALLEQVAAHPGRRLSELSLPPPAGVDPTLPLPEPRHAPVPERVAGWARRAPQAVALRQGERELSYGALDAAAEALALALVQRGLRREGAVAVTGPRSFGLIAAMLAALRAGGRLLTLDPALPAARRRTMIARAGATHALVVGARDDEVLAGLDVIAVAADAAGDVGSPAGRGGLALPALAPDDAAYVFFTSGSTGVPKGVLGCHKGLAHFLDWQASTFAVGPGDRVAQLTGLSFDVVLRDVFLALVSGATLVLPEVDRPDPDRLLRFLERERLTLLHAVPSLVEAWLREAPADVAPGALRVAFFAGEPLEGDLVRRFRAVFPAAEVVNLYGPTETTLAKCFHRVPAEPAPGVQPVGRPLPETQALVLSPEGRLCGVGEPGEITLRTPFRSLGYLDAAETAARFTPSPFRAEAGDLLYRTGDRGRYRPDGALEILGRLDHQLKIRGVRVEPGEVEAALRAHPAVRQAVVIGRGEGAAASLCAYVVPASTPAAPRELRAYLAQRLPDALVPADVVVLAALPLTANGKVDRAALPPPDAAGRADEAPAGARGPVEEAIAAVFAEVLGRDRVGPRDGFFALGGHSLLATQVVARVRRAFGVELPLRRIFESPTAAALAEHVEAALRAGEAPPAGPLDAEPDGPRRALSFAEERLWLLDRLEPGGAEYVIPVAARLLGPLDAEALGRAVVALVERHDALRTTFTAEDGRPVAVVHAEARVALAVTRPAAPSRAEREAEARAALAREIRRPFDLTAGPLLRALLLAVDDEDHLLVLTLHHIVADGWTVGVLRRELSALYAGFVGGALASLPPAPRYGAYARWQRRWMAGDVLAGQLAYWRSRLGGAPPELERPADHPRPPAQTHRGARHWLTLPPALAAALAELGRREGVTLFMTLLAALDVLLYRHTGARDLVVGTPIANRTRAETESLVGLLANTLALRVQVAPEGSFRALLAQVREACLGAYAHQELPFERLVQELAPERDLRRAPVFQVMLTLQNAPAAPLALAGLTVRPEAADNGTAKLELAFTALPGPEGLRVAIDFATDRFEAATIARMAGHLEVLLAAVARAPGARVDALPLLTEPERHRLLRARNEAAGPLPGDLRLHELFEAQAARTPGAVAVTFEQQALTFRELDARANALARELQARGVGADTRVGLGLPRSLELVVALLGVLKAGGAYLPVDLSHPRERIDLLLADAGVAVIVTHAPLAARFAGRAPAVVALDAGAPAPPWAPPPPCPASAESLAYVIHTSGSTGHPKAAMIPHRAIVNHMLWMNARFPLAADDVVLQKTPLGFDASVWEVHAPLSTGARLHLARADGHRDPAYLLDTLAEQRVTVLQVVPALLELLLAEPVRAAAPALRRLFCGGEALTTSLSRRAAARFGVPVVNLYGPTEAAVDALFHVCAPQAGAAEPIGRPLTNTRAYVLDEAQEPAPEGVAGELYLGGAGVGRGYLGRPGATAERFVPDPFGGEPGARLYRTGDRARLLDTGVIEYLGRADDQVKVRGHRVELGEVEAALGAHPGVREAVAVVREDAPGERRLVAYVVGPGATAAALYAFLHARLPEFMIPAAFVTVDRFPLSASGKIDRRALPAPPPAGGSDEGYVAPRTTAEAQLAGLWAEVLRLPRVGIHDHFFAVGGDSILAIQLVARARQAGLRLSPREIFQRPTVAELAAELGAGAAVTAEQGPVTGLAPLTPIQRAWLAAEPRDPHHFNQAFLLAAAGALDPVALDQALAAVLDHHDALRLRLVRADEGWEQSFAEPGGAPAVRRVDLSPLPPQARPAALEAAAAEAQASLDLARGPLVRAALFTAEGEADRLLVVIHHLAVDAVSWGILLGDLWAAYAARREGLAARLPARTTSFKQWATRLEAYAQGEALAEELAFWRGEAQRPVLPLPVDHARGEGTEAEATIVRCAASPELTEALLRRRGEAAGARVDALLLAALALALGPWVGRGAVRVDVEGHGREPLFEDLDVSRTVGWFTSVFPVVLDLDPGARPADALRAARDRLGAIPHRGLGHGLLGDRVGAAPPAEIGFNYLGQLDATLSGQAPLRRVDAPTGPLRAPRARRRHRVDVDAAVLDGRLEARFTHGADLAGQTLAALGERFLAALAELLAPEQALTEPLVESVHPLAPLAQGMLFHTLYAADPGVYLTQKSLGLRGALDEAALRGAFADVLDRHPSLRVSVAWEGLDRPVQRVHREARLPVVHHDLRGLGAEEQAAAVARIEAEDRRLGFALERAPLMRLALLRLDEEAWRVLWSFHHLLLDGWSTQIVLGEVFTRYGARARGLAGDLATRRPYADYLAWLGGQDPARAAAFWRSELRGFPARTPLGVDRPALPDAPAATFAEQRLTLPASTSAALLDVARRLRVTPSTLVQGAWAVLLSRYSGEDDVLFGVTVSGRSAPVAGIEGMVGLFINTLPLRVLVEPDREAGAWLAALHERQAQLRDVEHVPLVEVQGCSAVPRGTPLFESLVVFESYPLEAAALGPAGLTVTAARTVAPTTYPLTLAAAVRDGLHLEVGYDRQRLDDAVATRLLGHLATLLAGIAADPHRPLRELPLLPPAERHRLLVEWSTTGPGAPGGPGLADRIAAHADRAPDAPAVVFRGEVLRYGDLAALAGGVAADLAAAGAGPGAFVPVLMERGFALVLAELGVLAAGAAFVPLDPEWPAARLAAILAELAGAGSPAPLLVDEAGAALAAALGHPARRVDRLGPRAPLRPAPLREEDPIYAIYTSGSTGKPKGVVIPHRGVLNRLGWMTDFFGAACAASVLQTTRPIYDSAVWQVFWPLVSGGQTVLPEPGQEASADAVAALIAAQAVTMTDFVPSVFAAIVPGLIEDDRVAAQLASLRAVVVGGEEITPAAVASFRRAFPAVRVANLYGPTEASIGCVCHEVRGDEGARIPIGRPITGAHAVLRDRRGDLVPTGATGEIHLGGRCLGLGYLGDPERTAAAFVANPFPEIPYARLYRTGDLGRHREDGSLEFLGRADEQVKIRGVRIELGEVGAVLAGCPAVVASAVIAREDRLGDRRLVAYVVPRRPLAPDELRRYLEDRLPRALVPSAFVTLPALPLTAGGKLDRRALPAPEGGAPSADHVPPRGPIEEGVAAVFAELIPRGAQEAGRQGEEGSPGLPSTPVVGAHDDFFALGGHSLLATRALSRLRAAFAVELPLRALFEAPTPALLAARIAAARALGPPAPASPLLPVPRGAALPLSFGQERLWFLWRFDPADVSYVVPLALRVSGALSLDVLRRALGALVQRHEVLRTTFASVDGRPGQLIHDAIDAPLPLTDLRALLAADREEAARLRVVAAAARPFDLVAGPLFRAELVCLDAAEHLLVVTMHHIVSDAWTMGLLNRDLAALYGALAQGAPSPLPALPLQYADYAAWQRRVLSGPALDAELAHWEARLAGAPAALALPADRPRPRVASGRGAQHVFSVPRATAQALAALGRREGATLFMTLLAAFDALLHRCSGQDDLVVGTPIANRTHADTERLAGFFVNTLALRVTVDGARPFRDLLARVREACLDAYAHQDAPFERVVERLAPARDPGCTPIFQVMFVLQNAPAPPPALAGLSLRRVPLESTTAPFELTLVAVEQPDGLALAFEYATDRFDAATVARLAGHLGVLLDAVAADPRRPVRELPLLTAAERRVLVDEWSATAPAPPQGPGVPALFAAQVERTPDAVALEFAGQTLTYRALAARTERLARHLRAAGVGPDVIVALLVERSLEMVIAILAVLEAGGAWVPLDPEDPPARLASLATTTRAHLVLCGDAFSSLAATLGPPVLSVSGGSLSASAPRPQAPAPSALVSPLQLAYVIHTSGSTGQPKGAMLHHRGLACHLLWYTAALALGPGDVVLQKTPYTFDASIVELVAPLLTGARVVLAPPGVHRDPDALVDLAAAHGVTHLQFVPTMLAAVVARGGHLRLPALRHLICGGEPLALDTAERFLAGSRAALHNMYGATEATDDSTCWTARPGAAAVSIGRPIAGTRVYLLDDALEPVPVGVAGVLHVGGPQVGRGYLGQPALTAERFLPDPFSAEPGARLYCTGDRARFLASGELEHLGRADAQLKVRGHRVEPGEIEAVLGLHPGVRGAVVLARGDALAAWVAADASRLDAGALREHCRARLPSSLVPARFAVLDRLPLLPSGKIDRGALRDADPGGEGGPPRVAPRDAVEADLVALWEAVLGVRPVGVHDGFFDLGGHSLLAVRLLDRVRERFAAAVSLAAFFQDPTVAALAELLRRGGAAAALGRAVLLPMRRGGAKAPFVCVAPLGARAPVHFAALVARADPDRPFLAVEPPLFGTAGPLPTLVEVAARCCAALPATDGPLLLGGYCSGGVLAFEMARQLAAAGRAVGALVLLNSEAPRPHGGRAYAGDDHLDWILVFSRYLERMGGRAALPLGLTPRALSDLPAAARLDLVLARARAAGAVRADTTAAELERTFAYFQAHARRRAEILDAALPAHRMARLTLLRARRSGGAPSHGWDAFAPVIEVHRVAGDNATMLDEPHVADLAAALGRCLDAADEGRAGGAVVRALARDRDPKPASR